MARNAMLWLAPLQLSARVPLFLVWQCHSDQEIHGQPSCRLKTNPQLRLSPSTPSLTAPTLVCRKSQVSHYRSNPVNNHHHILYIYLYLVTTYAWWLTYTVPLTPFRVGWHLWIPKTEWHSAQEGRKPSGLQELISWARMCKIRVKSSLNCRE